MVLEARKKKSHQAPHTSAALWQCNHFVHWILHLFFLNISLPSRRLPVSLSLSVCVGSLLCMHFIFILTLNGISSQEITHVLYYFNPELRTAVAVYCGCPPPPPLPFPPVVFSPLCSVLPFSSLLVLPRLFIHFISIHTSSLLLSSSPHNPHLSFALNQIEHIKSGRHSRQCLL